MNDEESKWEEEPEMRSWGDRPVPKPPRRPSKDGPYIVPTAAAEYALRAAGMLPSDESSQDLVHLPVVQPDQLSEGQPHRNLPADIRYKGSIEWANCAWCRWRGITHEWEARYWDDTNPKFAHAGDEHRDSFSFAIEGHLCLFPAHVQQPAPEVERPQVRWLDERERSIGLRKGRAEDWNHDGKCICFEPNFWTRLLRRFGLRAPAWRDE